MPALIGELESAITSRPLGRDRLGGCEGVRLSVQVLGDNTEFVLLAFLEAFDWALVLQAVWRNFGPSRFFRVGY